MSKQWLKSAESSVDALDCRRLVYDGVGHNAIFTNDAQTNSLDRHPGRPRMIESLLAIAQQWPVASQESGSVWKSPPWSCTSEMSSTPPPPSRSLPQPELPSAHFFGTSSTRLIPAFGDESRLLALLQSTIGDAEPQQSAGKATQSDTNAQPGRDRWPIVDTSKNTPWRGNPSNAGPARGPYGDPDSNSHEGPPWKRVTQMPAGAPWRIADTIFRPQSADQTHGRLLDQTVLGPSIRVRLHVTRYQARATWTMSPNGKATKK
jgi:hypothetical protein